MEWVSTNWELIMAAFRQGQYFSGLINPLGLAFCAVLILASVVLPRARKKLLLVVCGTWAYITVHHFTLEKTEAELRSFDVVAGTSSIGDIALFFIGCALITGVLLYFILVRD